MSFEHDKNVALTRMRIHDHSDIGKVDPAIKPLVELINSLDAYYTTSSCSGRIILLETQNNGKKKDAKFLFRSHEWVEVTDLIRIFREYQGKSAVTFRMQAAILHICARTIEDALKLIGLIRPLGFKRSGIFSAQPERVIIEAIGPESIVAPIIEDGKKLIDEDYLDVLSTQANSALSKNLNRLDGARKVIESLKFA